MLAPPRGGDAEQGTGVPASPPYPRDRIRFAGHWEGNPAAKAGAGAEARVEFPMNSGKARRRSSRRVPCALGPTGRGLMVATFVSMTLVWGTLGGIGGHFGGGNGWIMPPGPGYGWGFPNGNPDGYGYWDNGVYLPLWSDRTSE